MALKLSILRNFGKVCKFIKVIVFYKVKQYDSVARTGKITELEDDN
jgi:hypothetical protein